MVVMNEILKKLSKRKRIPKSTHERLYDALLPFGDTRVKIERPVYDEEEFRKTIDEAFENAILFMGCARDAMQKIIRDYGTVKRKIVRTYPHVVFPDIRREFLDEREIFLEMDTFDDIFHKKMEDLSQQILDKDETDLPDKIGKNRIMLDYSKLIRGVFNSLYRLTLRTYTCPYDTLRKILFTYLLAGQPDKLPNLLKRFHDNAQDLDLTPEEEELKELMDNDRLDDLGSYAEFTIGFVDEIQNNFDSEFNVVDDFVLEFFHFLEGKLGAGASLI